MINQNGHRPVNLLRQHDPAEPVRPRHEPQRKYETRILAQLFDQSVRPADEEDEVGCPPLDMSPYEAGKVAARELLAALVEGDDEASWRHNPHQSGGLFRLPFPGGGSPRFRRFMERDGGQAAGAAGALGTAQIVVDKHGFRSGLEPSDR